LCQHPPSAAPSSPALPSDVSALQRRVRSTRKELCSRVISIGAPLGRLTTWSQSAPRCGTTNLEGRRYRLSTGGAAGSQGWCSLLRQVARRLPRVARLAPDGQRGRLPGVAQPVPTTRQEERRLPGAARPGRRWDSPVCIIGGSEGMR
jgi:hypothetical protein